MQFSFIIPTYNNLEELRGCLNALGRLKNTSFEVFVCVDGSTDGTQEALSKASFPFPLHVLSHPGNENRGRAATRNLALPHIKGEYTVFLDSDMESAPDLLDAHLGILQSGRHISLGPVIYRNERENLWARYTSERGICKFNHGEKVPYHYFITPNTAIRTEWFRGVEGFDEDICHYGGEDMELGFRIYQKYGPDYLYNARAKVFTVQDKKLDAALVQLREYGNTGLPFIVKKHPELSSVYWVNKCSSSRIIDRLFEGLTRQPFRGIARSLIHLLPYGLQKTLINYLVISFIHEGFRNSLKAEADSK